MELSEIFRKNLKRHLRKMPRGSQSRLADVLSIGRKHMSDFLAKRKPLSETKREEIANELGYLYEDFLAEGRRLLEGIPPEAERPPHVEPTPHILKLRRISDHTGEGNSREGIIALFQDRESARQINLHLVEIEKADREQFVDIRGYIRGVFKSLDIKKEA